MSEQGNESAGRVVIQVRGERLALTITPDVDPVVVGVAGELDLASAPVFSDALADVGDDTPLLLDLGNLRFLDAAGLRELVALARGGRVLVLRNPSRLVRRVLAAAELDGRFTLEET